MMFVWLWLSNAKAPEALFGVTIFRVGIRMCALRTNLSAIKNEVHPHVRAQRAPTLLLKAETAIGSQVKTQNK